MAPFALGLTSVAVVLGTLGASPALPPDLRVAIGCGAIAFCGFALSDAEALAVLIE